MCLFGARSFYRIETRPIDLCRRMFDQLSQPGKRDAYMNCLRNASTGRKEFENILGQIRMPSLVMWGEFDRVIPPRTLREFRQRIPNSKTLVMPECGHSIPLEKPNECCRTLLEFLGETRRIVEP